MECGVFVVVFFEFFVVHFFEVGVDGVEDFSVFVEGVDVVFVLVSPVFFE